MKKMSKKITKKELKRRERIATNNKFKEWSILVRNRDNNKCVICGENKYLNAHHIIPRENVEFRFNINNGITLCVKHHKYSREISAHKNSFIFLLWLMNNKKEQFEYLYNKVK